MRNDKSYLGPLAVGIFGGFIIGIMFSLVAVRSTAKHPQGYGLECANIVLNNPSMAIDTIRTICNQDTTTTYEFCKRVQK